MPLHIGYTAVTEGRLSMGKTDYRTEQFTISEERMRFTVVSQRPEYSAEEKETVKADIERQLFTVFSKYV